MSILDDRICRSLLKEPRTGRERAGHGVLLGGEHPGGGCCDKGLNEVLKIWKVLATEYFRNNRTEKVAGPKGFGPASIQRPLYKPYHKAFPSDRIGAAPVEILSISAVASETPGLLI